NVSGNEVRVAFNISLGQPDYEGPIRTQPNGNENSSDRTARILQQWFNDRFQFWGRRLTLVAIDGSDSSTAGSQAPAIKAASEDNRRFTTAAMAGPFAQKCGGTFAAWADMDGGGDSAALSTAVARLRTANVTTVVLAADLAPAEEIMAESSAQGYYPEWLIFY